MQIAGWITQDSWSRLQPTPPNAFSRSQPRSASPTLKVDDDRTYQPMEGFGFALTGGSASLIAGLDPDVRNSLLNELFGTAPDSIGLSCLRLSIGASDLSRFSFSYQDVAAGLADPALTTFDLFAGDPEIVPVLLQILAINPSLRLIAAPWSAPPWMKTNGRFVAGELRPDCYPAYARYLTNYLRAMRTHGIRISSLTPQNEPLNPKNEPSMVMSAAAQAAFIRDHLGPAIKADGLGTEIFCWDHNCDEPSYPLAVLGDPLGAEAYVSGVAWHLYAGSPSVLSTVHDAYPNQKMYFTEQWVREGGDFKGDLRWHIKNIVIGTIRNWSRLVLEWNLASDPQCDPHTPGGAPNSLGGITIGETIIRNVGYYIMAHAAKFIRPGSVRIDSTELDNVPNVAFRTPDERIVLLVLNDSDEPKRFSVKYLDSYATMELDAGAVATYRWDKSPAIG